VSTQHSQCDPVADKAWVLTQLRDFGRQYADIIMNHLVLHDQPLRLEEGINAVLADTRILLTLDGVGPDETEEALGVIREAMVAHCKTLSAQLPRAVGTLQ